VATPTVNQTVVVQAPVDDVQTRLLGLAGTDGYRLIGESYGGFGLRRRRIPVWAIVLAVVFFPFGLLFLLVKSEDVVSVAIQRAANGTEVSLSGRATRGLQYAFQSALGAWQIAGAPAPRWHAPAASVPPPPPLPPPAGSVPPPPPAAGPTSVPPPPPATAPDPVVAEEPVAEVAPAEALPDATPPLPTWTPPTPPPPPLGGPPGGVLPMPLGPIGGPPGGVPPPPAAPPGGLAPLDLPDAPWLDTDPSPGRDRT
jgi:hypothetical protein